MQKGRQEVPRRSLRVGRPNLTSVKPVETLNHREKIRLKSDWNRDKNVTNPETIKKNIYKTLNNWKQKTVQETFNKHLRNLWRILNGF